MGELPGADELDISVGTSHKLDRSGRSQATPRKMHPHTETVLKVLRKQLDNAPHVNFSAIATGVSRRTAAACFFEILQLKTWDVIDVQQGEPYGEIHIAQGPRYEEPARA
jgi:chromatin segregation and condensation protein Rec8/ScpA/Scc1 (kleisin family)